VSKLVTIPNLTSLSKQELFDMSARHIIAQGKQSARYNEGTGSCVYSGSGCAAAPFILPEMRAMADGFGAWRVLVREELAPSHEATFIRELQACHDNNAWDRSKPRNPPAEPTAFLIGWRASMGRLAEKYNLNIAALDGAPVAV